jgi:glycosyltransferase involved in cell wall biosynthesis
MERSVIIPPPDDLCVALAHDQLATMGGAGGAENVLCAIKSLFPAAPVYTTVYNPEKMPDSFREWDIRTSFVQRLPGARTRYQLYLPLMPTAVEQLDFEPYDLVISGNHSVIKGIVTRPDALHICYCYSPIRYAWDLYHRYLSLEGLKGWQRLMVPWLMNYIRLWDASTAHRVDAFVAISHHVRQRIQKYYRREAAVIYPPVETRRFAPRREHDGFYLMVGRLVGYKRHDLAIDAFNRNGRPLVIIGDGPERARLEPRARANVRFLGRQSEAVVTDHLQRCRGFIFAGEEDFGIAPVEAMACGRPVLAYARGGALETVVEGMSGLFFRQATADGLNQALLEAETHPWNHERIAQHAEQFSRERFLRQFSLFVERTVQAHRKGQVLPVSLQVAN